MGLGLGGGLSYIDDNTLNRHFISHTTAHIDSGRPGVSAAVTLPLRTELTLNENGTFNVYSLLSQRRVGYTGSGHYTLDSEGVLFSMQKQIALDVPTQNQGVIENLFVRTGAFDGRVTFARLGEGSAALIGNKMVYHMTY
nr:hypothetical protein [Vibrio ostreicida]